MAEWANITPRTWATDDFVVAQRWNQDWGDFLATWVDDWIDWKPVLTASVTAPTYDGGQQFGAYRRIGKYVSAFGRLTFPPSGSTAGSGGYWLNLPVPARSASGGTQPNLGHGFLYDSSATNMRMCQFNQQTDETAVIFGAGAYIVSDASPWAWTAGDGIAMNLFYEGQ